jgi:hypothetical protein
MGKRDAYAILLGKIERRGHWEALDVRMRIILKFIIQNRMVWTRFIWLRMGISGRLL